MRLRFLLPSLATLTATVFAVYGAQLSVLLPAQVARIAPDDKVAALALVTSVSALVTIVAQPLIGALSDGTRSRFGRRRPWILGAALVSAALLLVLGPAGTLVGVVIGWAALQFTLNGIDIASSSFLVDSIPARSRGRAASVFGIAAIGGGAAGIVLLGGLADDPRRADAILAAVLLVVAVAFVLTTREGPLTGMTGGMRRPRLRGFDPRRHPGFAWFLGSRLAFTLGHQGVYGYLLYIVIDHVGLEPDRAVGIVGLLTIVGGAGILLSSAIGGWLSDRLATRKPFVIAGCLCAAAALAVPLLAPTVAGLVVLAALQGIGFGLFSIVGLAWASQLLPGGRADAGRDLGLLNVATNVGQVVAPLLAAALIGLLGYPFLFVVGIAAVLASAALLLPIPAAPSDRAETLEGGMTARPASSPGHPHE